MVCVTLCVMSLTLCGSDGRCDSLSETMYSRGVEGFGASLSVPQHMAYMLLSCQATCLTARLLLLLESVCALCILSPFGG